MISTWFAVGFVTELTEVAAATSAEVRQGAPKRERGWLMIAMMEQGDLPRVRSIVTRTTRALRVAQHVMPSGVQATPPGRIRSISTSSVCGLALVIAGLLDLPQSSR